MNSETNKAIRVLVIFATNNVSGPGKGLFQLIENSDPKRVQFTVCNFRHPTQETFEFLEVAKEKGIDIRLITQRFAWDPMMVRQTLGIARSERFDVVQSHGYKTHILAWIVTRKLKLPWVALSHGWTSENFKIRIYNEIERYMLRLPHSAIGVAPALFVEARSLRKGRRSRMILNAIEDREHTSKANTSEFRRRLNVADDHLLIGVFGRLSHEKGQDLFIEAISRSRFRTKTTALLLGEGHARSRLELLAKKRETEGCVLFLGYQSDIIDFYRAVDVCVLPSRSEGLPNVVLEAQLHGRPVIAFNVGGVGETIVDGETGYLVSAGDVDGLAEKIDWAHANRAALSNVAKRARDVLFPKFSTSRRCEEFLCEYQWLTSLSERDLRQHG